MKKSTYFVFIWCVLLIFSAFAGEITVSGKANVEGRGKDAKAAARTLALKKAEKKAVDEGIKLFLKDQAPNTQFAEIKEKILNDAGSYISDKFVVKDVLSSDKTIHLITIEANVDMNKIAGEFKSAVSTAKNEMGNPSITFVLTTYEKKGTENFTSANATASKDVKHQQSTSGSTAANAESQSSNYDNRAYSSEENRGEKSNSKKSDSSDRSNSNSRDNSGSNSSNQNSASSEDSLGGSSSSTDGTYGSSQAGKSKNSSNSGSSKNAESHKNVQSSGASEAGSESQNSASSSSEYKSQDEQNSNTTVSYSSESSSKSFDERLWKKQSDATIIDAFQQEFKEKNFDLMATDKARRIALASSDVKLNINPLDREAVRAAAEKEGATYVARGEVMIIDVRKQSGSNKATVKLGVEIVDVNSGDIVASYSNTASALNTSADEAIAQAIKKNGVLGARTLADQTLTTWSERASSGQQYTVVLKNFTSVRSQQRPFMMAVKESVSNVINTTSPDAKTLIMKVSYKGKKDDLGWAILDIVGVKPGFEEAVFDGPVFDGGTLTFTFK